MVRDEPLVRDVVGVEAEVRLAEGEGADRLAERKPLQVGQPDLDQEMATGLEMRGDVLKARDLLVLRRQILDRVVDEVGQTERPVLAKSPIVTPIPSAPGLA